MSLFILKRLFGLAQIADGLMCLMSPARPFLGLAVARRIARSRAKVRP